MRGETSRREFPAKWSEHQIVCQNCQGETALDLAKGKDYGADSSKDLEPNRLTKANERVAVLEKLTDALVKKHPYLDEKGPNPIYR